MKLEHNVFYESPSVRILEVKVGGIFCDSNRGAASMNVQYEEEDW